MQDSAGAVIGALIGSWLLQYDFIMSAGLALLFLLLLLSVMLGCYLLIEYQPSEPLLKKVGRVLKDKRFVTYVVTLAGYFMLSVQVMLMFPIVVNELVRQLPSNGCMRLKQRYP